MYCVKFCDRLRESLDFFEETADYPERLRRNRSFNHEWTPMDTNREAVDSCLFVCISGWKSVASVNHLKKSSRAATNFAYSSTDDTDEHPLGEEPSVRSRRVARSSTSHLINSFPLFAGRGRPGSICVQTRQSWRQPALRLF